MLKAIQLQTGTRATPREKEGGCRDGKWPTTGLVTIECNTENFEKHGELYSEPMGNGGHMRGIAPGQWAVRAAASLQPVVRSKGSRKAPKAKASKKN